MHQELSGGRPWLDGSFIRRARFGFRAVDPGKGPRIVPHGPSCLFKRTSLPPAASSPLAVQELPGACIFGREPLGNHCV